MNIAARCAAAAAAALLAAALPGCGGTSQPTTPSRPSRPAKRHAKVVPLARDFVGVVAPEVLGASPDDRRRALQAQHRAGIRLLRQTFDWRQIEPQPGVFDFTAYDALMTDAARAGLDVLPVVFGAPSFAAAQARHGADVTATTTFPPHSPQQFADFVRTLAQRYGPHGTFWSANPSLPAHPIRAWQIWNEPNLPAYWGGCPSARGYVALLRAAARAIKRIDRHAEVVTAGIPDSRLGIPLGAVHPPALRGRRARHLRHARDAPLCRRAAGVLAGVRTARRIADGSGEREGPHLDHRGGLGQRRARQRLHGLARGARRSS